MYSRSEKVQIYRIKHTTELSTKRGIKEMQQRRKYQITHKNCDFILKST